jgi:maltose/moltooligosaccharide transporter
VKRKVSYFKIFLLGFGFFGISILWSLYNSDIPIMLKSFYNLSYTASGWVMNVDNILAITLIPLVGFWSDHVWTRIGRRMPFIISTLPVGAVLFALVPWIPLWFSSSRPRGRDDVSHVSVCGYLLRALGGLHALHTR